MDLPLPNSPNKSSHQDDQYIRTISRGFGINVLLGLGLGKETLTMDGGQLHYQGVQLRGIIWRAERVRKTIYVKDVSGFSTVFQMHPFLVLLLLILFVNLIAGLVNWEAWWNLYIWKLPYGWVLASVFDHLGKWQSIGADVVMILVYGFLIWWTRRLYWVFDGHVKDALRFRCDGISSSQREAFESAFLSRWHLSKGEQ